MKILASLCLFALSLSAADFTDHGFFRILSSGVSIGTERFDITATADGYQAKGEIKVKMPNGQEATETSSMSLNKNLVLTSYTRSQNKPKKAGIDATFSNGPVHVHYVTPEGQTDMDFFLEPMAVVLDTNFFHHYFLLLERYAQGRGGAQHVQVFVPQEATPGILQLEYLGKEQNLHKWLARTEVEVFLWTDDKMHLMKVAVPSAKVEVVREEEKKK